MPPISKAGITRLNLEHYEGLPFRRVFRFTGINPEDWDLLLTINPADGDDIVLTPTYDAGTDAIFTASPEVMADCVFGERHGYELVRQDTSEGVLVGDFFVAQSKA